jgi:hypothetical protein
MFKMEIEKIKQNKVAGKTIYSGRRRNATRKSGFKSHSSATGGKYYFEKTQKHYLPAGRKVEITFAFPKCETNYFYGFGVFYKVEGDHKTFHDFDVKGSIVFHENNYPSWSKFGSIWKSDESPKNIQFSIEAISDCYISIYGPTCGTVWHEFFETSRKAVLKNIAIFSPEGLFIVDKGDVSLKLSDSKAAGEDQIALKECNRCARFLPVNFNNERDTLCFSNHCIARSPCKHKGFGILTEKNTGESLQLLYGFQLECRFCKKFAVNAALNIQRTADQMKEDGQRRRHFELLLAELNSFSPQMYFRHKTGQELTEYIWEKFDKKCFKCNRILNSSREMNLDHTRPLALLWQLDETATCLCKTCNSQKRDRFPKDFYDTEQLKSLSEITGIPYDSLLNPQPNIDALNSILSNLDWLYGVFLSRKKLTVERDGKITAELVCKALDRVLSFTDRKYDFSFIEEYHKRNSR